MKSDSKYGKSSRITQTKQVAGDVRLALTEKGMDQKCTDQNEPYKGKLEDTKVSNRKRWQ